MLVRDSVAFRITIIIPFRLRAERSDALERLHFARFDTEIPIEIRFLVVDDGSKNPSAVEKCCAELGYDYLRLDTGDREFSVGRCRNAGAMHASTPYIFMQDVDLMPGAGFYSSLLREIDIQGLEENQRRFLMVPYVYLTLGGTRAFRQTPKSRRAPFFFHQALVGNTEYIENISTGTSANLYNRHWYLSRGGNAPDFEGWGYEDLEYNCRMICHLGAFPKPENWSLEKYNFNSVIRYESWKAPYRLLGDLLWNKGIVLFHAWHEQDKTTPYHSRAEGNRSLFVRKLAAFERSGEEPPPLPDLSRGRTLLMRKNAFTCARDIQPLLGTIVPAPQALLASPETLQTFVAEQGITRILFHNPYSSKEMLALYRVAREQRLPYFVAERGALPNSLFFDATGFLRDGLSYQAERWDRPLSEERREATQCYLRHLRESGQALEKQPTQNSVEDLRQKLGISATKKILFLALQRPTDSVTRHFCGAINSYGAFLDMVREVAAQLPDGWTLVAKRHPLEDEDFALEKVKYANDCHIHDLLTLSDAVITFNSGVGVLAIGWGKPVFVAGQAFYEDPRLARVTSSSRELLDALQDPFQPDDETKLRFLSYLLHDFYSFGDFSTKRVKMPDGSNMTATTDIRYRILRGLSTDTVLIAPPEENPIGWNAPILDRYRMAESIRARVLMKSQSPPPGLRPIGDRDFHSLLSDHEGNILIRFRASRPRWWRLLRKLWKQPGNFLNDSRNASARWLGRKILRNGQSQRS